MTLRGCDLRARGWSIEGQTYLLSTLDLKGRSRTYTPCCSRSTPVRTTAWLSVAPLGHALPESPQVSPRAPP